MRLFPARSRPWRAALGLLLPIFLGACAMPAGCQKTEAPDAGAAVVQDLSPIPAPEGLIGDLFVPAPDATWAKARALVGGPAVFLPQGFGALAATLLKLPITAAGEIDGSVPVVGAALKQGSAPSFGALGIHLRAGDRFIDQLTRGEEARFTAQVDGASRITVLTLKQPPPDGGPFIFGVLGNYLLVAARLRDLQAAGPYVARTLASRPAPREDVAFEVPEPALSGAVLENLRMQWSQVKTEVSNANVPITPFAGTVGTVLDALGDAKQARLTLELDAAAAHARFTLAPKAGEGPATKALKEMVVGDPQPLLDLPATTQVGLLWRDSAAARAADVPAQADALAKLIDEQRVSAEDKETIAAALRAEGEARGEWATIGLSLDPRGAGATARVAVADEEKMSKALKQLTELAKLPGIKALLKGSSLALSTGKTVVENLPGDVQRVRFERTDKAEKEKAKKAAGASGAPDEIPSSIDLLYLVTHDVLFAAVGSDPREALRALAKPPGDANLGSIAAVKGAIEALGREVSYALVTDPLRLIAARTGKSAPAEAAPVVLALGKTGGAALLFGRLDVSATTIQELIKHRDAF